MTNPEDERVDHICHEVLPEFKKLAYYSDDTLENALTLGKINHHVLNYFPLCMTCKYDGRKQYAVFLKNAGIDYILQKLGLSHSRPPFLNGCKEALWIHWTPF